MVGLGEHGMDGQCVHMDCTNHLVGMMVHSVSRCGHQSYGRSGTWLWGFRWGDPQEGQEEGEGCHWHGLKIKLVRGLFTDKYYNIY